MWCTSPLFPFFTAVFFWASTKELLVSCFPRARGAYPSFRPAKASEVPGAHKSHWLFVTLPYQLQTPSLSCQETLPKDVNITQLSCTSFFPPVMASVPPNHWLNLTDSIWFSLSSSSLALVHLCAVNKERMQNRFDRAAYRTSLCAISGKQYSCFSLSLPFHLSRSFLWSVAGVPLLKKITMT